MKSLPIIFDGLSNQNSDSKQKMEEAGNNSLIKKTPKRILLNMQGQIMVLGLNDITYLKSSSNYTIIKMSDGSRYTSSKHLKVFSNTIESNPDFLRIHRSSIVNKNFVKAIFRKGNKITILMKDNEELDVSAKKKELILQELSK
jgi:two-component system LytT family response regulator